MSQSSQFGNMSVYVSTASSVSLHSGMAFVILFNSIVINLSTQIAVETVFVLKQQDGWQHIAFFFFVHYHLQAFILDIPSPKKCGYTFLRVRIGFTVDDHDLKLHWEKKKSHL